MRVVITLPARESLRQIYNYFKRKKLSKVGNKLRSEIIKKALILKDFPNIGQVEENLSHLNQEHRYLVKGNYKIIYRIIEKTVFVTDVFDTRQNPSQMKT